MIKRFLLSVLSIASLAYLPASFAAPTGASSGAVGEKVPSEDSVVADFHSLGLVDGKLNLFRCACPVRDLGKAMSATQPSEPQQSEAIARLRHLHDLGIRTIVSFQDANHADGEKARYLTAEVNLEKAAADAVGIRYVACPVSNAGPDSLETMTDDQVQAWLEQTVKEIFHDAQSGGVAFHCSAGHDRTGLVCAYIRVKYQHWPVDQAIEEMRRYGHNWPKYSHDGVNSWHEQHLRAIAEKLESR